MMRIAPGLWLRRVLVCAVAIAATAVVACGKSGPPLPPLVKIPTAPANFTAERRGGDIRLQFIVPAANTDGTRPANVERVDVYAFTGPAAVTDDQLLKLGTRVASVPVKAPRNPDVTTEPDEPAEEPDLEDEGLDQGSIAQLEDPLQPAAFNPVDLPKDKRKVAVSAVDTDAAARPLVGPPPSVASRIYVTVGVNKRGRKGPVSRRVTVPLVAAPSPPSAPTITYDETTISVTWTPSPSLVPVQPPAAAGLLPGRSVGMVTPTIAYHVYDFSSRVDDAAKTTPALGSEVRLTKTPIAEPQYKDARIEWGATRCYTVRTVETVGGLTLESDAPAPECTTLKDTFPPLAPKELTAIATAGTINLIWEPNSETDLAGYFVLRGVWPAETLDPITTAPIPDTTFKDAVQTGARYVYAVRAIDKAGNASPLSNRVDETAR